MSDISRLKQENIVFTAWAEEALAAGNIEEAKKWMALVRLNRIGIAVAEADAAE